MGKTRRIFISDIHLSSQQLYDNAKKPAWYDPAKHNPRLLGFLDSYVLKHKKRIKDLVLLGDIFNTWVCPADKYPPTYDEIFSANKTVINKLKEIMKAGGIGFSATLSIKNLELSDESELPEVGKP